MRTKAQGCRAERQGSLQPRYILHPCHPLGSLCCALPDTRATVALSPSQKGLVCFSNSQGHFSVPLPGPKATVLLGIMVEAHVPQDQGSSCQIYFTLRVVLVLVTIRHTKHSRTLTGKGLSCKGVLV